jgi:hypothetical protein
MLDKIGLFRSPVPLRSIMPMLQRSGGVGTRNGCVIECRLRRDQRIVPYFILSNPGTAGRLEG